MPERIKVFQKVAPGVGLDLRDLYAPAESEEKNKIQYMIERVILMNTPGVDLVFLDLAKITGVQCENWIMARVKDNKFKVWLFHEVYLLHKDKIEHLPAGWFEFVNSLHQFTYEDRIYIPQELGHCNCQNLPYERQYTIEGQLDINPPQSLPVFAKMAKYLARPESDPDCKCFTNIPNPICIIFETITQTKLDTDVETIARTGLDVGRIHVFVGHEISLNSIDFWNSVERKK